MKNLIFSLNATVPVFLLMALGFLFRKLGWLDEVFAQENESVRLSCAASASCV